jgi:hypothetical protein
MNEGSLTLMKGCINTCEYNLQYGDEICVGHWGLNDECICIHSESLNVQINRVVYTNNER